MLGVGPRVPVLTSATSSSQTSIAPWPIKRGMMLAACGGITNRDRT